MRKRARRGSQQPFKVRAGLENYEKRSEDGKRRAFGKRHGQRIPKKDLEGQCKKLLLWIAEKEEMVASLQEEIEAMRSKESQLMGFIEDLDE